MTLAWGYRIQSLIVPATARRVVALRHSTADWARK